MKLWMLLALVGIFFLFTVGFYAALVYIGWHYVAKFW